MPASSRQATAPGLPARLRVVLGSILLLGALLPAAGSAPVLASHTPAPSAVTIAGSLQSELGCSGDWMADCAATHLAFDADDGVWQGTFAVPAGDWEYKAPLNDAWDENYGLHATAGGANIPLSLGAPRSVKFYYDHESHWVTDNVGSVIAVAPGSFQSELGCAGDWDPGLPALLAQGRRRRRHVRPRDDRPPSRQLRDEGRDQRGVGRELRPGRRPRRREHRVHGPDEQRQGHLHLRRFDPCPDRPRPATATTTTSSGMASATTRVRTSTARRAARSPPARR